ncbi:hypothetical protein [Leptospira noguchii]|uniref:hypothetical protein n=1 Tax=Leptospira noguchii TaxID=28182 RepID=UPI001FB7EEAD|nr:hypothetical protein [Leptospira noguchii]UOG30647.1 hypothetical protein MAL06_00650 [Leptospira noguchii]
MKFASCDDDPGNSVNAYLWVGVQGVVALSLLFAPIFLRRTHVILILFNFRSIVPTCL